MTTRATAFLLSLVALSAGCGASQANTTSLSNFVSLPKGTRFALAKTVNWIAGRESQHLTVGNLTCVVERAARGSDSSLPASLWRAGQTFALTSESKWLPSNARYEDLHDLPLFAFLELRGGAVKVDGSPDRTFRERDGLVNFSCFLKRPLTSALAQDWVPAPAELAPLLTFGN